MKYLLDTHAFLWFVTDDDKLSSTARSIIKNSNNEVYFSAASAWEMSIKIRLGRLTEDMPLISKDKNIKKYKVLVVW